MRDDSEGVVGQVLYDRGFQGGLLPIHRIVFQVTDVVHVGYIKPRTCPVI